MVYDGSGEILVELSVKRSALFTFVCSDAGRRIICTLSFHI